MNLRKFIISLLEYILAFIIVLEYFTVYRYFIPYKLIIICGSLSLLLLIALSNKLNKVIIPTIFMLVIYYVGSIIPYMVTSSEVKNMQENLARYIVDFLLVIPLLWFYIMVCKKKKDNWNYSIVLKVSDVVVFIASISLFFWIFGTNLEIITPNGIVPYFWEESKSFIPSYFYLYFETQDYTFLGVSLTRNSGIFTEAPVYNFILCVSLIIETFYRGSLCKIKIFVLIATILSTITNTGQVFLFIYIVAVLFCYGQKRKKVFIPILGVIFLAYIIVPFILEDKINNGNPSYEIREYALKTAFDIASDNMFWGTGVFSNYETLGNNSFLLLFSEGGIYMSLFYLIPILFIPFFYMRKYKDKRWILANACFMVIFTITIALYNWITYLFISVGLSNINLKKTLI